MCVSHTPQISLDRIFSYFYCVLNKEQYNRFDFRRKNALDYTDIKYNTRIASERSIKDIRVYHRFDTELPPIIQNCFERWIQPKRIMDRRRDIQRIKRQRRAGGNESGDRRRMARERFEIPREVDKRTKARLEVEAPHRERDEDKHNSELSRVAVPSLTYFTLERGFCPLRGWRRSR